MKTTTFQARYQVADGYAGGARPQHFKIDARDLEDDMDEDALETFYEESIQVDFENKITTNAERVSEFIAWAKECLAERSKA